VAWTDLRFLPGIFLFWAIGHLQGTLLLAALARRQEKAADLYGWSLIGRVEPFITAIKKLTDLNLIVYDKTSQWRYLHPATTERIAAAQQYAKAHGEVIGGNEA
jgi:Zn-dependent protease with chaperone function